MFTNRRWYWKRSSKSNSIFITRFQVSKSCIQVKKSNWYRCVALMESILNTFLQCVITALLVCFISVRIACYAAVFLYLTKSILFCMVKIGQKLLPTKLPSYWLYNLTVLCRLVIHKFFSLIGSYRTPLQRFLKCCIYVHLVYVKSAWISWFEFDWITSMDYFIY